MCRIVVINYKQTSFDFDTAFGVAVVRRFLCGPWDATFDVFNVIAFPFGFDNPHRNFGIFQMLFVEVKNHFFTGKF